MKQTDQERHIKQLIRQARIAVINHNLERVKRVLYEIEQAVTHRNEEGEP